MKKFEILMEDYSGTTIYDGTGQSLLAAVVRTLNVMREVACDSAMMEKAATTFCRELSIKNDNYTWRYAKHKDRALRVGDKVHYVPNKYKYSEGRAFEIHPNGVGVVRTWSKGNDPLGDEVFWHKEYITHADGTPIDWDATVPTYNRPL